MDRKIYRQIAKKHGVSAAEVKRDMQVAIDEAYQNPNAPVLAVPRKGAVPSLSRMRQSGHKTRATVSRDDRRSLFFRVVFITKQAKPILNFAS